MDLVEALAGLNRLHGWELERSVDIGGDIHHPQGMFLHDDRWFVSTVDMAARTGELLVVETSGRLVERIEMTQGDCYHPGGCTVRDGVTVVPVAEYRPWSRTVMCRVDCSTGTVTPVFEHDDHLGAAAELPDGGVFAFTWGSRQFVRFDSDGAVRTRATNPAHFVDHQDLQLVADGVLACTGVNTLLTDAGLAQLGGIGLLDLSSLAWRNDVPFPGYSPSGRVATYNPTWFALDGDRLTLWAIPDDGRATLQTWVTTVR